MSIVNIVLALILSVLLIVLQKINKILFVRQCHDTLLKAVKQSLINKTMEKKCLEKSFTVDHDIFGTHMVFFTRQVLSTSDCQTIIDAAEGVSKKEGYTTRAAAVTTRDQLVSNLPMEVQHKVFRALQLCVRQYADYVPIDDNYTSMLPRQNATFVIRYDKDKSDCKPHYDTYDLNCVSVVINLSAPGDYVGGGTEFYDKHGTAKVACPHRGHGVVFHGTQLLHGGAPTTSGVRFVLVALFSKNVMGS